MKKIILAIVIVSFIAIITLFMTNNKYESKDGLEFGDKIDINNEVVGEFYKEPIIIEVLYDNNEIKIIAGRYRYGDINRDGVIDDLDIQSINYIINSYFTYTEDQKELSDLDQNGLVDDKDMRLLQKYLSKNNRVNYEYQDNSIMYAISNNETKTNLKWQVSNTFEISEFGTYYAFIKDSSKIYNPFEFNYDIYNEDIE